MTKYSSAANATLFAFGFVFCASCVIAEARALHPFQHWLPPEVCGMGYLEPGSPLCARAAIWQPKWVDAAAVEEIGESAVFASLLSFVQLGAYRAAPRSTAGGHSATSDAELPAFNSSLGALVQNGSLKHTAHAAPPVGGDHWGPSDVHTRRKSPTSAPQPPHLVELGSLLNRSYQQKQEQWKQQQQQHDAASRQKLAKPQHEQPAGSRGVYPGPAGSHHHPDLATMAALGLLSSEEVMLSQLAAKHGFQDLPSNAPVIVSAALFLGASLLLVVCCCLFASDDDSWDSTYVRSSDKIVRPVLPRQRLERRHRSDSQLQDTLNNEPTEGSVGGGIAAAASGTPCEPSSTQAVQASRLTLPASACERSPRQPPSDGKRPWGLAALDGVSVSRMMSPDVSRLNLHPGDPGAPSPTMTPIVRGTGPASGIPPSLCSVLTLQHCDAWFAVPLEQLAEGSPGFQIFGLTGRPLLKAQFAGAADGHRSFSISMMMERSPVIGSVHFDPRFSNNPSKGVAPLEVRGIGGHRYGFLEAVSPGRCTLRHESGPALAMEVDSGSQHLFVSSLVGNSGAALARAARCRQSEFFSGVDHLQVCVNPGVDALLILCAIVGVLTFGEGLQLVPGRPLNFAGQ